MICTRKILAAITALLLLTSTSLHAVALFEKFIDPADGKFDTSGWLIDNKGFLPVPIIITEPAVGTGLGLAGVFFHESDEGAEKRKQALEAGQPDSEVPLIPPSVSVLVGGGIRYLIARRLGLLAGVDVAKGPEDTVFYLTVGSAWR
jgi:hypothetical protein